MCVDCKENTFNTFYSRGVQFVHKLLFWVGLFKWIIWIGSQTELTNSLKNQTEWFWEVLVATIPLLIFPALWINNSNTKQYLSTWLYVNDF